MVQGALNADGVGKLLSGFAGTLPSTPYGTSVAIAEVAGVSARRVGVVIGVIFVAVAFFPKFTALLIAIPAPVAAGFLTVLIGLLFVPGNESDNSGRGRSPEGRPCRDVFLAGNWIPERMDIP